MLAAFWTLMDRWRIDDLQALALIGHEGGLTKKLTLSVGWYSKTAHAKILELGGTANNLKGVTFEFPKPKKKFVLRDPEKKVKAGEAEAVPAAAAAPAPAEAAPKAE